MKNTHIQNVEAARDILLSRMGDFKPKLAIILGSGLSGLSEKIENPITISYQDLPGFPHLTVKGHIGEIVVGHLNGVDVLVLKGRQHFYEVTDPTPLKTMIRTLKWSGIETLFISNAAGSLHPHIQVGELMLITDHINYMGLNPLAGPNDDEFGPRFFTLTDAWDPDLGGKLKEHAKKNDISLHEGIYVGFRGPSFETPAEIQMAFKMGGSAIGMSSVPDCIIARHCGLKVVGCSCITNMGAGLSDEVLTHKHTIENAKKAAVSFEKLVFEFVRSF